MTNHEDVPGSALDGTNRRARGSLDRIEFKDGTVAISGWLLSPDARLETVSVYLNGRLLGNQEVAYRKDMADLVGHIAHAGWSGFAMAGYFEPAGLDFVDVTVIGSTASGERFVFQRYHLTTPLTLDGLPPEALRKRVSGTEDPKVFRDSGADNALQFIRVLKNYLNLPRPRVLDWGCGSGRIHAHLMRFWPEAILTGCDIDAEAVEWCNSNLCSGAFHTTGPLPPLPFADAAFDGVIGYSVMTHLPRRLQQQWLTEIRRILAPGGVFATTVHGAFAANLAPDLAASLARAGILDKSPDPALDGVAPVGYYRTVFQTPAYTREHWGRHFEILDYAEGGLSALHDLVTMRRPAGPARLDRQSWAGTARSLFPAALRIYDRVRSLGASRRVRGVGGLRIVDASLPRRCPAPVPSFGA